MSEIMIDTETLGKRAGCVILSIGAVEFDKTKIIKEFEVHIDTDDSVKRGLSIDVSTVMWWLEQDKTAQQALLARSNMKVETALRAFNDAFNFKGKKVWCNGASFDFPIMNAAYQAVGLEAPWDFWNEMDMRTIKNAVGRTKWKDVSIPPTIAHSALADAISQAKTLQKIFATPEIMKW